MFTRYLVVPAFLLALSAAPALATEPAPATDGAATAPLVGDPVAGEERYASACAECHRTPARILRNVPGDGAEARAAWLETFLADHHAPIPQRRADIVAWLMTQ